MFRTMRRFKQELTREECLAVLLQPRGAVTAGENGYLRPAIDYWYNETDGSSTSTVRRKDTRLTPSAPAIRRPSAYDEGQRVAGSGRCILQCHRVWAHRPGDGCRPD